MNKFLKATLALILLVGAARGVQHGIGMQADMVGQGYAYRLLTPSGWGAEIVGRAHYELKEETFDLGGEARILKFFEIWDRMNIFVGVGAGAWQERDIYYEQIRIDDTTFQRVEQIWTQGGYSGAALAGVEIVVFELSQTSGFSITPEFQFGYYSRPGWDYSIEEEPQPRQFISPGVGIGFRYYF